MNEIIFVDIDEVVRDTAKYLIEYVKINFNDYSDTNDSWNLTFSSGKDFLYYYNSLSNVIIDAPVIPNCKKFLYKISNELNLTPVFISVQPKIEYRSLTKEWLINNFLYTLNQLPVYFVSERIEKINFIHNLNLNYLPILLDDYPYTQEDVKNKNVRHILMNEEKAYFWNNNLYDLIYSHYFNGGKTL